MRATPFASFSSWNDFSMTANIKCIVEQKSRAFTKPLPIDCHWFTILLKFKPTISALNYSSKHIVTNCIISIKNVIFRHHYIIKNISSTETEQRYPCRLLHFNRQNLMSISPPNDYAAACDTCLLKISYWTLKNSIRRAKKCLSPKPICAR